MQKLILIVDNSAIIRERVRVVLERHSCWEVCGEAVNGLDGLLKARDLRPDLVVLDLSMPMMNGLEAARELRQSMPLVHIATFTSHNSVDFGEKQLLQAFQRELQKTVLLAP